MIIEATAVVSGLLTLAAMGVLIYKSPRSAFRVLMSASAIVLLVAFVIVNLEIRVWGVSGDSMLPTIEDGDTMICIPTNYEAGDMVQLISPLGNGYWVKRIIGVPGDRIAVWGNYVEVNGVADTTSEKYQKSTLRPRVYVLQYNQYFVCGDNREVSYDSRYVGPIEKELILTETLFSF